MATAHPPLRKHTTRRVSPSTALTLLSSYLSASTTNPSLRPDALLTESGPLASSTDGLTLHNLRRIEAGLRGENLGADLTFSKFGGQGLPNLHHPNGSRGPIIVSETGRRDGGGADEEMEGWQDREEFEREQEVVVGAGGGRREEMMKRGKGSEVKIVLEEDDDRPISGGGGGVLAGMDKEERKRRKKERKKNDAREKEKRREREKDLD